MFNLAGRMQLQRFMCLMVRHNFSVECEKALNAQINLELKASHDYLAMAYHFSRSDVALPGVYGFFQKASTEEREHAELLMKYMNTRGGQIVLECVPQPKSSYASTLEAMQEAFSMEKIVNESLLEIHQLAGKENDPSLCDFIEANFLQEQISALKQIADFIRQIGRCDNELGAHIFDVALQKTASMHTT